MIRMESRSLATPHRRVALIVLLGGAVVVAALAAFVMFGFWNDDDQTTPTDRSAEAGFARDMQTHHAQAVQMAFIIRDKTDDNALRAISYDIITTQQQQIGQMFAWLEDWNLPHTGKRPMAWMPDTAGMDHGGQMPGMASEQDLSKLERLNGAQAEELFLRLMIDHHRGGIAMARTVQPLTDDPRVATLAESMAQAQQAEIDQMTKLLARYQ